MSVPRGNRSLSGQPAEQKFPRSMRLLRHADFEKVYKQGRRHFSKHMTFLYLPREDGEGFRFGFTVGRVFGGAVVRNRMKRRLREIVRLRQPGWKAAVDVVVNPKKSLLEAGFEELLQEVARALETIHSKVGGK